MAQLDKMNAKQLKTWIVNLEQSIKADDHPGNQEIYKKWLKEAKEEQQARLERKERYLYCKTKGFFG